jgi:hypothetical protein
MKAPKKLDGKRGRGQDIGGAEDFPAESVVAFNDIWANLTDAERFGITAPQTPAKTIEYVHGDVVYAISGRSENIGVPLRVLGYIVRDGETYLSVESLGRLLILDNELREHGHRCCLVHPRNVRPAAQRDFE